MSQNQSSSGTTRQLYLTGESGGAGDRCGVCGGCAEGKDPRHLTSQGKIHRGFNGAGCHTVEGADLWESAGYSCCYSQEALNFSPACPGSARTSQVNCPV